MYQFKTLINFTILFIIFLFISSVRDFGTNIPDAETFSLIFNEDGGFSGVENFRTKNNNHHVTFLVEKKLNNYIGRIERAKWRRNQRTE